LRRRKETRDLLEREEEVKFVRGGEGGEGADGWGVGTYGRCVEVVEGVAIVGEAAVFSFLFRGKELGKACAL
jgi:hypothetical protein